MVNKRGISAVVATVLIIMITVAAIGLVWAVIIPMVRDNLGVGDICKGVDVTIVTSGGYTCYQPSNLTIIQINKGNANVNVSGLKFYLGALGNSITYNKDVSFLANDYKTFYLNSSTISKLEQIEVVPIVNSGNAEKSCSAIYLDSIPTCSDGSAVIGNGPGQIPEEQIIQVTVPIPTGEPFVDLAYPIFSNYLDNNGTLTVSGKGWFNVTLSNANGTVILEIDNTNITATNLSLNVYNVSYNFISNGTYSYKWYSWGNGTSHNPGVSSTGSYVVSPYLVPPMRDTNGDGYIEIHSCEQLQNISNNLNVSYELSNNIDCINTSVAGASIWGGNGFIPLGDCGLDNTCDPSWDDHLFLGNFKGNNFQINNLFINRSNEQNVALFGAVSELSNFFNVNLINVNILGFSHTGGLIGASNGTTSSGGNIFNCYVSGNITGDSYVGGLVGESFESIYNSSSLANIKGNGFVGGLVGKAPYGSILNCSSNVSIIPTGSSPNQFGGIAGRIGVTVNVVNSSSVVNIGGNANEVGGIVGLSEGNVINSFANVNITGSASSTGGIVGYQSSGAIINCSSSGSIVVSNNYVGGLVGWQQAGTISNSSSSVLINISSFSNAGGLVGKALGTISASYSIGNINGSQNIGGLVGWQSGGSISNSYSWGNVSGSTLVNRVGGLVGNLSTATITNSYSIGNVTGCTNPTVGCGMGGVGTGASNSFWDMNTSGRRTSSTGIGKNTTQMLNSTTFATWVNSGVWNLVNGQYPKLIWQS